MTERQMKCKTTGTGVPVTVTLRSKMYSRYSYIASSELPGTGRSIRSTSTVQVPLLGYNYYRYSVNPITRYGTPGIRTVRVYNCSRGPFSSILYLRYVIQVPGCTTRSILLYM